MDNITLQVLEKYFKDNYLRYKLNTPSVNHENITIRDLRNINDCIKNNINNPNKLSSFLNSITTNEWYYIKQIYFDFKNGKNG